MGKSDPIWWHVPIQTHISKELFNINPLHFTLWISTLWNHINQGQHFFSIMWEWCLWKPYPPWKFCCPHLPGKLEDVTLPYKGVLQRGPLCFPIFAFRPHLSLFLLRLLLNDLLSFSMSGLPSESLHLLLFLLLPLGGFFPLPFPCTRPFLLAFSGILLTFRPSCCRRKSRERSKFIRRKLF